MRIACHYFEGKTIQPVTPGEIKEDSSSLRATDSDASSSAGTESDGMQSEDPQKVPLTIDPVMPLPCWQHAADCCKPSSLTILGYIQAALVRT